MSRRIQLEREKRQLTQAAFASGVLAESQFSELESLQTPDSMNFVAEVTQSFADETPELLVELHGLLRAAAAAPRVGDAGGSGGDGEGGGASGAGGDAHGRAVADARAALHKLKGSALTLGAKAVGAACEAVRVHCISGNPQAALAPAGDGTFAGLQAAFQELMDVLNKYTALQAEIAELQD